MPKASVKLTSTITCPECDQATEVEMPTESCQFFWESQLAEPCFDLKRGTAACSARTDVCLARRFSGKMGPAANTPFKRGKVNPGIRAFYLFEMVLSE
ncbi:hypothetical protein GGQ04_002757 [Salinibacter ruber]|jgi:hypothetical protein|nr:hypothetical protein [Salinibacter ruber]